MDDVTYVDQIDKVILVPGYHEWLIAVEDEDGRVLDFLSLGDFPGVFAEVLYENPEEPVSEPEQYTRHWAEDLLDALDEERQDKGLYLLQDVISKEQKGTLIGQIVDEIFPICEEFNAEVAKSNTVKEDRT